MWSRPIRVSRMGAVPILIGMAILTLHAMPPAFDRVAAQTTVASPVPAAATPVASQRLIGQSIVPAPPETPALYISGGLSRSVDGGASWELVGALPPAASIAAAVDDPALLLAGTFPSCGSTEGAAPVLYRSINSGASWNEVPGELGTLPLAIWAERQIAVGAGCEGLRLSTDAGQTWSALPLLDPAYPVSAFAPVSGLDPTTPALLVVGTSKGATSQVWRLDFAASGPPTISPPLLTFWGGAAIAGEESGDRGQFYVLGTANGVLRSHDGGATWEQSRAGLEAVTLSVDPNQGPIPEKERQRGYGITAVAIDPARPERLFAGSVNGLFVSVDGGATWAQSPLVTGYVSGLHLTPEGRLLIQTPQGVVILPV